MVHPAPRVGPGDEPVDLARLAKVLDEVGGQTLRRYAEAYLDLLTDRLDGIEQALGDGHGADAVRLMIDLRVNSAMLGANRLVALVAGAETALPTGRPIDSARMAALRAEAAAVSDALRRALDDLSGPRA
jgi:hypothetical protein